MEHTRDGVHWDLLLQDGPTLKTWALDRPIAPGEGQPARPLPDHRPLYLDYEGPISGGRGTVRRVDSGTFAVVLWTEGEIVATLGGDQLIGEIRLSRVGADSWSFFFEPGNVD